MFAKSCSPNGLMASPATLLESLSGGDPRRLAGSHNGVTPLARSPQRRRAGVSPCSSSGCRGLASMKRRAGYQRPRTPTEPPGRVRGAQSGGRRRGLCGRGLSMAAGAAARERSPVTSVDRKSVGRTAWSGQWYRHIAEDRSYWAWLSGGPPFHHGVSASFSCRLWKYARPASLG